MNNQFTRYLSSRDAFNRDCRLTTIFPSRMRRHKRACFEKRTARFHRKIREEFTSQIERPVASGFPQSSEGLGSLFLFRSLESRFDGTLAAFIFLPHVDAFSTQHCSSLYSPPGTFWSGFSCRNAQSSCVELVSTIDTLYPLFSHLIRQPFQCLTLSLAYMTHRFNYFV